MPASAYDVLVAEDEKLIRDNIVEKIQGCDSDFVVVGAVSNGAQALEVIQSRKVDVLFTDIRMPVMDGLELASQVRSRFPGVQVVIISGYADFDYAQQAIHLGVEEYMLKPIKMDLLASVLREIKTKIIDTHKQATFELVRDAIHGNLKETHPASLQEYFMFLLNIGNLCSAIASLATRNLYAEVWKRFDFAAPDLDLLLIDAPQPNARYIVLPSSAVTDCRAIGKELFQEFVRQAQGISINLICGSVSRVEALYSEGHALSHLLSQNLVMDQSNLIEVDRVMPEPLAAVLEGSIDRKLTTLIAQGQTLAIKIEVQQLIAASLTHGWSQLRIQDFIRQLFRLFQKHSILISEVEIFHAEYDLFDKMALPNSSTSLFNHVWSILETLLHDTSKEAGASKEMIDSIQNYIKMNFNNDISLEIIARRYNLSTSHLVKIFRKQVGETPMKYLITLRMEEAKRLLDTYSNLDIKQIGEIVGYADPHYFSRIFKNVTSFTPTEYRNRRAILA
jgi:two-component system, response regulator YesN